MKVADIKPIVENLFSRIDYSERAFVEDEAGTKFYHTEVAYKAVDENLLAQAMLLEVMYLLAKEANYWGEAPIPYSHGRGVGRVSTGYDLRKTTLVWRVLPEVTQTDDGVTGYARFCILHFGSEVKK